MKAVVFADTRSVRVEDVPDAELEEPTDVVVRISSSAICGTDLHMYDGRTGRARPSAVVTHHGRLDDAPQLYQAFDQGADGVIKTVLRPSRPRG